MKIQHVFCSEQHRSAITPVVEEMRVRGHEVVEVKVPGGAVNTRRAGYEDVDVEGSKAFLCSYPHIIQNNGGGYKKAYGEKICIEHGVNPVAWAFPLDRHGMFDHVFLSGQWQLDAIRRSSWKELEKKAIMTGWPKADALANVTKEDRQAAKKALMEKLPLNPNEPIVSFVPTHGAAWYRADELITLGIKNLVIAPHEGRYADFRQSPNARGTVKLKTNYFDNYPNYIETGNIYEVLMASDVIIGDYSSAILEALILDLPVIQLLAPIKLHNREEIDVWKQGWYSLSINDDREFMLGPNIRGIEELLPQLELALNGPELFWRGERNFWKNEIFTNIGGATKTACDTIEQLCNP